MRWVPIAILSLFMLCSCSAGADKDEAARKLHKADITTEAFAWADSMTSIMSVEQKAAQMLMPAIYAQSGDEIMAKVRWYAEDLAVGGLLLLKGDAFSAAAIADTLESIRNRQFFPIGYFLSVDAETGLGMRFSDAPMFPWNRNISPDADEQLFYEYGREVGRESRLAGINMVLGPVVDVHRMEAGPRGVMRERSLGSDQLRVAELSLAYASGVESQNVLSVAKHFPGHGPTAVDSHAGMPVIRASRDEIYTIDLMPFRTYINNGLSCIMVGHLWVSALDSVKRPASFSDEIMERLLREEMGFQGLILVDAVGMGGARGYTGADAIAAGADIVIAPDDTRREIRQIVEAVDKGKISERQLDEHCRRILFYKYLFNVPFSARRDINVSPGEMKKRLRREALPIIESLIDPEN